MSSNICPCKGCEPPKRYPGCGGKCPEYKEWKTSQLLGKAVKDAAKAVDKICDDYAIKESIKNGKARGNVERYR